MEEWYEEFDEVLDDEWDEEDTWEEEELTNDE